VIFFAGAAPAIEVEERIHHRDAEDTKFGTNLNLA
jgi:hypothetical protein